MRYIISKAILSHITKLSELKECDVFVKTKAMDEGLSWNLVIKLFFIFAILYFNDYITNLYVRRFRW